MLLESSSSSVVEINDADRIFESIRAPSVIRSANAPASELLDEVSQVQTSAKLLHVLTVSAELDENSIITDNIKSTKYLNSKIFICIYPLIPEFCDEVI